MQPPALVLGLKPPWGLIRKLTSPTLRQAAALSWPRFHPRCSSR